MHKKVYHNRKLLQRGNNLKQIETQTNTISNSKLDSSLGECEESSPKHVVDIKYKLTTLAHVDPKYHLNDFHEILAIKLSINLCFFTNAIQLFHI